MDNFEIIDNCISMLLDDGKKDIVILPMGKWGEVAKKILNQRYNIIECGCLDNYCYDGEHIFAISQMPIDYRKCVFLIVVEDEDVRNCIFNELRRFVSTKQIVEVFESRYIATKICNGNEKVKLDFLCVGFQKCGTSSLHQALQENNNIFLPLQKETFFLKNINEKSHDVLKKSYLSEKIGGKIVGGIEPSYFDRAKEIYEYFGADIKLIFCMGNPVRALQSAFRMCMRDAERSSFEYIKKYRNVSFEFFDEWAKEWILNYEYVNHIREFMQYYDINQMKFVLSEDLYRDTNHVMEELQKFIGLHDMQRKEYEQFPRINSSKRVSKNVFAAYVNQKVNNMWFEETDIRKKIQLDKLKWKIFEITTKVFEEKMPKEIFEKYKYYYKDSVCELESILGRNVSKIWNLE